MEESGPWRQLVRDFQAEGVAGTKVLEVGSRPSMHGARVARTGGAGEKRRDGALETSEVPDD